MRRLRRVSGERRESRPSVGAVRGRETRAQQDQRWFSDFLNLMIRDVGRQRGTAVAMAHAICAYSKATRRNIEVNLLANGKPVEGGHQ